MIITRFSVDIYIFYSVTLGQMNNVGTKVIVGDVIARIHEIH